MPFKPISEITSGISFNSKVSCNFKDLYDSIVYNNYKEKESHIPGKRFAPSSFRCKRMQFFRLRGVEPDKNINIDPEIEFLAFLGTCCHEMIQKNLIGSLNDQWVEVEEYLKISNNQHPYKLEKNGYETLVEFLDIPIKFACDGIIKIGDKYYLLEIKSADHQSFLKLDKPKAQHIDQVKCYCALLNLNNVLMLYIDRQYGETKCFELEVKDYEKREILDEMNDVLEHVHDNIAPSRLPKGDWWCNTCKYAQRCSQWG